jgi:transposase-like protein
MIDGRADLCPPVHYPISRAIICCCNVSRLPETQGDKPAKRKFKSYPIGYFHVDIAEVRTEEGKLYLFVAIDRTSKFAYAQLHEKANRRTATSFLKALIKAVPYKIHTVLTDNGIQFTDLPKNRLGPRARWRVHMFDSFVMRTVSSTD